VNLAYRSSKFRLVVALRLDGRFSKPSSYLDRLSTHEMKDSDRIHTRERVMHSHARVVLNRPILINKHTLQKFMAKVGFSINLVLRLKLILVDDKIASRYSWSKFKLAGVTAGAVRSTGAVNLKVRSEKMSSKSCH
jgi:hypothetical protein